MQAAAEAASPSGLLGWLENLLAGDRRGSLRLQGVTGTLGIDGAFSPIQDLSRTGVCITGYAGILRPGDQFRFDLVLEEGKLALRLPGLWRWSALAEIVEIRRFRRLHQLSGMQIHARCLAQ